MKAEHQVRKTIEEHSLIYRGDVLVLGLSGGPDSLCLLDILMGLKQEYGFELIALHVNHCIRGEEADADEVFLREYCKDRGIRLEVRRFDVPMLAAESGESEEACGRRLRHEALSELANEEEKKLPHGCSGRVVLAHNADDQAETVLLRILRGTGTHGLGAMKYLREDGLIRPLLDTDRASVEEYCRRKGLQPRTDSTNGIPDYTRNKLRLEIMPKLREINPNITNTLNRLAENSRQDDDCLECEAFEWLEDKKGPELPVKELRDLFPAIFSRVVKMKFAQLGLSENISSVHINALLNAVYGNVGNKTIEFPCGYSVYINHGTAYFRKPGEK